MAMRPLIFIIHAGIEYIKVCYYVYLETAWTFQSLYNSFFFVFFIIAQE